MSNFRNQVVEELIKHIEAGTAPWQKPWEPNAIRTAPFNPVTGKSYRGINAWWLEMRGYSDPRWMTYRQAKAAGAQVMKGEKGTLVEYWKWTEKVPMLDEEGNPVLDADGNQRSREYRLDRPKVFHAVVFNAQQIEGLEPYKAPEPTFAPDQRAEEVLATCGVQILHDQADRAFYTPMQDRIHMPPKEAFKEAYEYYATALHEQGHATGHRNRLAREFGPFGTEAYAKEELRAEMASFMVSTELGLGHYPDRHASYLKSWLRVLKDDHNLLFAAARDAELIRTWIMEPEKRQELAAQLSQAPEKGKAEQKAMAMDQSITWDNWPILAARHLGLSDEAAVRAWELKGEGAAYAKLVAELPQVDWTYHEAAKETPVIEEPGPRDPAIARLQYQMMNDLESLSDLLAGQSRQHGEMVSLIWDKFCSKDLLWGPDNKPFDRYVPAGKRRIELLSRLAANPVEALRAEIPQNSPAPQKTGQEMAADPQIPAAPWPGLTAKVLGLTDEAKKFQQLAAELPKLDWSVIGGAPGGPEDLAKLQAETRKFNRLEAISVSLSGQSRQHAELASLIWDSFCPTHPDWTPETLRFEGYVPAAERKNELLANLSVAPAEALQTKIGQQASVQEPVELRAEIQNQAREANTPDWTEQDKELAAREGWRLEINPADGNLDILLADDPAGLRSNTEARLFVMNRLQAGDALAARAAELLVKNGSPHIDQHDIDIVNSLGGYPVKERQRAAAYDFAAFDKAMAYVERHAKRMDFEEFPGEFVRARLRAKYIDLCDEIASGKEAPGDLMAEVHRRYCTDTLSKEVAYWSVIEQAKELSHQRARIYLDVPFAQKDLAKAAGAEWDMERKAWFVPPGTDTEPFQQWMKAPDQAPAESQEKQQGAAPAQEPSVYLTVPFEEKDLAKAAGAKWDKDQKAWFVPAGTDLEPFKQWLQVPDQAPAEEQQMPNTPSVYLDVPFAEKEQAKGMGAKWDPKVKAWYVPDGVDPEAFAKWKPGQEGQERTPPSAPVSEWLQQKLDSELALAKSLGVVDEIERSAAEGKTAAQVVERLGDKLEKVVELAQINGEPGKPINHKLEFVRNIRGALGIPPVDQREDFSAWLAAYQARTNEQQKEPPSQQGAKRIYLNVPFTEKNQVKAAGARWSRKEKSWYVPPAHPDPEVFKRWMGAQKAPERKIDPSEEFAAALKEYGLILEGPPSMDGKWHRVAVEGDKKGQKSGSYRAFLDGRPAGQIMNYRNGDKPVKWVATGNRLDPEAFERLKAESAERKAQQQMDLQAQYRQVAKRVYGIFVNAEPAPDKHLYLQTKGVPPGDLKVDEKGNLLVPMRDVKGYLWNIQKIEPGGTKTFTKDGRMTGLMHVIKGNRKGPTIVAEGYSTAATLHAATGLTVVVAFNAGNLEPVARELKKAVPELDLVIAADDDHKLELKNKPNVGLLRAEQAAQAVGGRVIAPPLLQGEKLQGLTDYNDLARKRGQKEFKTLVAEQLGLEPQKARKVKQPSQLRQQPAEMAV
ncbi:DUF5710 domain-containing protein [Telmatospirillum sp. J64-1]|uniref:DUF5710 domain-containing protein n=1 Tax=Telmatospirillum sp. J64-1 TaxID=2502183 RepID=UPI00115DCE8C|nr:DUF5710 domain-containing protein [Telmatospirillum sp. J64-1]